MRVQYVILVVQDLGRSVAFYRDGIGLPVRFESPGWSEFATEGATLALHAGVPGPAGPASARARPGLGVPDVDAFHRRMMEQSVECLQEPHTVYGSRVALYADPDGQPFSVGESRPD